MQESDFKLNSSYNHNYSINIIFDIWSNCSNKPALDLIIFGDSVCNSSEISHTLAIENITNVDISKSLEINVKNELLFGEKYTILLMARKSFGNNDQIERKEQNLTIAFEIVCKY